MNLKEVAKNVELKLPQHKIKSCSINVELKLQSNVVLIYSYFAVF